MTSLFDGAGLVTNGRQRIITLRVRTESDPPATRTVQVTLQVGGTANEAAAALRALADRLIQPIRGGA